MSVSFSKYRGHETSCVGDEWFYMDLVPVIQDLDRPCGFCGKENTEEGHDGCLGTLPGVQNACCGHGEETYAYLHYDDGTIIRGRDALKSMGQNQAELNRREFLKRAGKFAAYTPPTLILLMQPSYSQIAQSGRGEKGSEKGLGEEPQPLQEPNHQGLLQVLMSWLREMFRP